jgi:hypothetical protein
MSEDKMNVINNGEKANKTKSTVSTREGQPGGQSEHGKNLSKLEQKIMDINLEEADEKMDDFFGKVSDLIGKIFRVDFNTAEGKKKAKQRFGIIFSAIATIFLGLYLNGNLTNDGKEYVNMIKTGSIAAYNSVTYDESFDLIFKNKKWEYIGEDDNKNPVVEFNGTIANNNQPVCIQFSINVSDKTFIPIYMDINGEAMSFFQAQNEILSVFEYAYAQKGFQTQKSYSSNEGGIEGLYDQIFSGVEEAMVDSYVNAANNSSQQVKVPEAITQTESETKEYVPNGTYTDAYNFAAFDETNQSVWYSYDADCFMSAYVNEGEPIIEFSNSVTDDHSAVIYYALPISMQLKDNGGFEYFGEVHETINNDFVGDIYVVWESGMDYNKPYVEIKDDNDNFHHSIAGVYEIQ